MDTLHYVCWVNLDWRDPLLPTVCITPQQLWNILHKNTMTTTTFVSASEKQLKATVNEFYGSCHAMVMVISKHDQRVVGQWPLNSGPKWLPLKSSKKLYLDNKCMSISVFQRLYLILAPYFYLFNFSFKNETCASVYHISTNWTTSKKCNRVLHRNNYEYFTFKFKPFMTFSKFPIFKPSPSNLKAKIRPLCRGHFYVILI